MATEKQEGLVDVIIDGLRDTATELEELRVQVALGKAEAKDLFEGLKRSLREKVQLAKLKVKQLPTNPTLLPLVNAMEHLEIQLALGLAETEEAFEAQRKEIEKSFHLLESKIETGIAPLQMTTIQLDIERFRAKLQLMALGYKLRKIKLEYNLYEKRQELDKKLDEIRTKLSHKEDQLKHKWENTKEHIKDAVNDLRSMILPLG